MTDIGFETNFGFLVGIKIHTQEYVHPHIYIYTYNTEIQIYVHIHMYA